MTDVPALRRGFEIVLFLFTNRAVDLDGRLRSKHDLLSKESSSTYRLKFQVKTDPEKDHEDLLSLGMLNRLIRGYIAYLKGELLAIIIMLVVSGIIYVITQF